ncbi:MAG TPA: beta-propeller fold lactonase family protein [Terracidiphilus sp.]|nr:beta-propeller fold lactonase family protein [Terracidiphilus sp.]
MLHAEVAVDGNPSTILPTSDGRFVFVSMTNVGGPNYSTPDVEAGKRRGVVSGVDIFRTVDSKLEFVRFIRIGSKGANGMIFLPGEKTIVVAAGDEGVVFLDVQAAIEGKAKPKIVSQGNGAGTWDVVAKSDGKYVFASNEYGQFQLQRGNIGVLAVETTSDGHFLNAHTIRNIPAGNKAPRLTLSPNGSRLYVVREIHPHAAVLHFFGKRNPLLSKHDCIQIWGIPPQANGLLSVIDVQKAIRMPSGEGSILIEMASGCSPVTVIEANDSSTLYVAARGDNKVLRFSPSLLESDPENAFLGAVDTGGDAPVGLGLLPNGKRLIVTNSNRFGKHGGEISIIDITHSSDRAAIQRVPAGDFPRNITIAPDGKTIFVANYSSRTIEVVRVQKKRNDPK